LVSLTLAPRRGLVWAAVRRLRDRGEVAQLRLLEELYWMAQNHASPDHVHERGALKSVVAGSLNANLVALGRSGWVVLSPEGVRLTASGLEKAQEALAVGRSE
jgi:manganese/zinc/iron transport system permease protein